MANYGGDLEELAERFTSLTVKEIEHYSKIGITDLTNIDEQTRGSIEESVGQWTLQQPGLQAAQHEKQVINLVLLGKTGAGKSATGNLILGDEHHFKESPCSNSCTQHIERGECMIGDVEVNIIDTPGFEDTNRKPEDICAEISKVFDECSDGIDGFLYVFNMGNPRFTKDQEKAFKAIGKMFGEGFTDNCFGMLTHMESKPSITSLSRYLEDDRNSSFSKLLNDRLEKRVVGINNADKTIYGRQLQRENIIKLILARRKRRYTSDKFDYYKLEQSKLVHRLPRNIKFLADVLRKKVSAALRPMSTREIKAVQRELIVPELVNEMMGCAGVQPAWMKDVEKAVNLTLDHQINLLVGEPSLQNIGLIAALMAVSAGLTIAVILGPEFSPIILLAGAAIVTNLRTMMEGD